MIYTKDLGAISNRPLTVKEERQKKDIEPNIQTSNLKSQEFWPNILQQLKQNGKLMLYANLINSRAVELNDMTIGIEFSSKLNDFRRQLLEKNEIYKKNALDLFGRVCVFHSFFVLWFTEPEDASFWFGYAEGVSLGIPFAAFCRCAYDR